MNIFDFKDLRPKPTYPTYPSYHQGDYLEDYFYDFYVKNKSDFDKKGRTLIPVSWTTLYVDGTKHNIQKYINALDQNGSYFAVSQHDDGIREVLPKNTIHFSAGGLGGGVPIPLVCSPIPEELKRLNYNESWGRDVFCSFIGSMTHPIRVQIYQKYLNNRNFVFNEFKAWSQTVSDSDLGRFLQATQRSKYTLASRGYGVSSFRLYEIFQLNSVPVYVSDKHWLPFENKIDWDKICVLVKDNQIDDLEKILLSIDDKKYKEMLDEGKKVWNTHFTLEGMSRNILQAL